jgi:hypothetical protein
MVGGSEALTASLESAMNRRVRGGVICQMAATRHQEGNRWQGRKKMQLARIVVRLRRSISGRKCPRWWKMPAWDRHRLTRDSKDVWDRQEYWPACRQLV